MNSRRANNLRNGFDENYIKHRAEKLEIENLLAEAFANSNKMLFETNKEIQEMQNES